MAKKRAHKQSTRSLADVERHRARLRKRLCSEFWVEQAVHGTEPLPAGWVTCRLCDVQQPPTYCDDGRCYECHLTAFTRRHKHAQMSSNWQPLVSGGF